MIIAFNGKAGSGKDTAASRLVSKHGFVRVAFADFLKQKTSEEFDLDLDYFHEVHLKDSPLLNYPAFAKDKTSSFLHEQFLSSLRDVSGRRPVNIIADKTGRLEGFFEDGKHPLFLTPRTLLLIKGGSNRAADPDFWVKKALNDPKISGKNIVITDLRYVNEAEVLKNKEAFLCRIIGRVKSVSADDSETQLDNYNFDGIINNTSTLDDLYKQTDTILQIIGAKIL